MEMRVCIRCKKNLVSDSTNGETFYICANMDCSRYGIKGSTYLRIDNGEPQKGSMQKGATFVIRD
jgi:hypothetical protein